jgi:hypothetical protein
MNSMNSMEFQDWNSMNSRNSIISRNTCLNTCLNTTEYTCNYNQNYTTGTGQTVREVRHSVREYHGIPVRTTIFIKINNNLINIIYNYIYSVHKKGVACCNFRIAI